MRLKFLPVCPACQSQHPEEIEPGTKVTCPDCDETYRAEIPEVAPTTAKSRAAAKKASPKKKSRAYKIENLGKLVDRFAATQRRALILTVGIAAGIVGAGVAVFALVGTEPDVRPYVLGAGGVLLLVAVVCVLMLRFGGSNSTFFEIRKKGVLYKTRKTEQFLFWEEIEALDIRREVQGDGSMKYEIYLVGSETIHLTPGFLGSLDDPLGLIKAIKRYSGKDFETAVG